MKSSVFLGLAAILVCATPSASATDVGGPILTDTTWNHDGSPYIVTSSIMLADGATLVIEPTVAVRFEPGLALQVAGTLVARGTEESPILFTSDQPTPAPGDWSRIEFLDQAADATFDGSGTYQTGCVLEHVIVEYAGADDYGAVNVDRAAPFLRHCEIRQNLKSGIYVGSAPPLRIEYCFVHDNQDSGIYFYSSGGNILTGNTVSNNTGAIGAGMYFGRGSHHNTLTGNIISQNSCEEIGGGICFDLGSGYHTLVGNVISHNSAQRIGGGVFFTASTENTVTNNTVTANNSAVHAGGIYFDFGDYNVLTRNTISHNSATHDIGGLGFRFSYYNTLVGNTINDNNTAGCAGGLMVDRGSGNLLIASTVGGNSTGEDGAGIYFSGGGANSVFSTVIKDNIAGGRGGGVICRGGIVTLVNCSFGGSSAALYGGAVCVGQGGNAIMENSVLWGDSAPDGPEIAMDDCTPDPSMLTVSYSNVQGGEAAVYVEPGCTLTWGPGNIDVDPLFSDPSSGGLSLSAGSPCIDAGDNTVVPRDTADLDADGCRTDRAPLDLDGNYRFHDDPNTPDTGVGTFWYPGVVDMGAYEYGSDPNVPDGPCFGEMNCDGAIDNFDINPFVLALTSQAAYQATYPDCNFLNADVNDDGVVDNFDINAFIALLVGT